MCWKTKLLVWEEWRERCFSSKTNKERRKKEERKKNNLNSLFMYISTSKKASSHSEDGSKKKGGIFRALNKSTGLCDGSCRYKWIYVLTL